MFCETIEVCRTAWYNGGEATEKGKGLNMFASSRKVATIALSEVVGSLPTMHMSYCRKERFNAYLDANDGARVVATFLVDRGCREGLELHNVTANGFDFVLNQYKHEHGYPCFITALALRPGQMRNLYELAGETAPAYLVSKARDNQIHGLNNV